MTDDAFGCGLLPDRLKHHLGHFGIDADSMTAIARRKPFASCINLNYVGLLVGHVAVNTISDHPRSKFSRHLTVARFVALQALPRKLNQISFLLMHIVAGRTGHFRAGAKTL